MGNDGGSIPRRNEMVREKKKDEKTDRRNQLIAMNFFCALSKQVLREPVVADGLGRLYNREAILEYLLDHKAFGDGVKICGHIKSLKDVKTLNLKRNTAFKGSQASDEKNGSRAVFDEQPTAQFICPISTKEMNGNLPFEFVWTCGCVFSAQARREMPSTGSCIVCGEPYDDKDIVPVNSLEAGVLDVLRRRMEERKASQGKRKKKEGKSKATRKHKRGEEAGEPVFASEPGSGVGKSTKVQKTTA
ncbi:Replication termination factor 2 [Coemansia sp. RSA 552]|nr:Replication termination factor 2 [Coemansia sp. RSA 552]